jgi:hypothetical protein
MKLWELSGPVHEGIGQAVTRVIWQTISAFCMEMTTYTSSSSNKRPGMGTPLLTKETDYIYTHIYNVYYIHYNITFNIIYI